MVAQSVPYSGCHFIVFFLVFTSQFYKFDFCEFATDRIWETVQLCVELSGNIVAMKKGLCSSV